MDPHRPEDDAKRAAWVAPLGQHGADGFDLDTELLAQFPPGGLVVALARLDLAAGKLPQTTVALALGPPRDEETAIAFDHRGDHPDDLGLVYQIAYPYSAYMPRTSSMCWVANSRS